MLMYFDKAASWVWLAISLCWVSNCVANAIPSGYMTAALSAGLKPEIGYAAALHRTGMNLDTGCKAPWPWTLALGGKKVYYPNRAEAHAALIDAIFRKVAPLKVGLMLVDGSLMGTQAVALLEPSTNLLLGMKLLKAGVNQHQGFPKEISLLARRLGQRPYIGCLPRRNKTAAYAKAAQTYRNARTPSQDIRELVQDIARPYRVDPALVTAVIRQESGFRPCAVSGKNAQGLMQLIPETQRRFGVRNPCDPVDNIRGGVAYLNWLLRHFNGNVALALAGYNAGEKAVEKYQGIPPYRETQNYVRSIMGNYPNPYHPVPPPA